MTEVFFLVCRSTRYSSERHPKAWTIGTLWWADYARFLDQVYDCVVAPLFAVFELFMGWRSLPCYQNDTKKLLIYDSNASLHERTFFAVTSRVRCSLAMIDVYLNGL